METQTTPLEHEEFLPVTFLSGLTARDAPVPTLYAIRFLCEELESALDTLLESQGLLEILSNEEEGKDRLHEALQRIMLRFFELRMQKIRQ